MISDELVHVIKQLAAQSQVEQRPWTYGHISNYDPATNSVRVVVPSMRDDQSGAPLHSGWLPLGVHQAGGQSGFQVVPFGGASADNPTAGELCMVAINERGTGVAGVICMFYTGQQRPPHTALDQGQGLQPGEVIIRHVSGTRVRLHQNGDVEVTTGGDGAVSATTSGEGGITATTTGAGSVALVSTGTGTVKLTSAQNIIVEAPVVLMEADLKVTGAVIAGQGTTDQVTLQHHRHGTSGSSASSTTVPSPGT